MNDNETRKLEETELKMVNGGTMGPTSSEQITESIIQGFSKQLDIPVSKVKVSSRLDELGADSLDVVDVVSCVEEKFSIKVQINAPIKTVGDLILQVQGSNQQ